MVHLPSAVAPCISAHRSPLQLQKGDRPSQSLRFQHQGSPSTTINCFDFALGKDKGNKLMAQPGRMAHKRKQTEEVRGGMR